VERGVIVGRRSLLEARSYVTNVAWRPLGASLMMIMRGWRWIAFAAGQAALRQPLSAFRGRAVVVLLSTCFVGVAVPR